MSRVTATVPLWGGTLHAEAPEGMRIGEFAERLANDDPAWQSRKVRFSSTQIGSSADRIVFWMSGADRADSPTA